jgi:hypothetical protein
MLFSGRPAAGVLDLVIYSYMVFSYFISARNNDNITNDFNDTNRYTAVELNAADPYSGRRLLSFSATLGEKCRKWHLM